MHVADVDELQAGLPEEVVTENALRKARGVATELASHASILGVDTVVAVDGRLYGKPVDAAEARTHLSELAGRAHEVWSGLVLRERGREVVGTARTEVRFRDLNEQTIDWYVDTGEWRDRAGGYAIQGKGAALVHSIDGDYWNVVGLPVALLIDIAPQLLNLSRSE